MNLNDRESLLLIEHMNKASKANNLAIEALEKGREVLRRMKSIESQTHITITESEWTTGENPQADKMVRVHINFGPVRHVGHISNDGIWKVYDLDGDGEPYETIKHYFGIVLSWRELTEEENTICWERGILGSSEEHAELSTLELPIAKQEPEWRPMSTAPRDETIIKVKLRYEDAALYGRRNDDNLWVCAEKMIYISTAKEFRRLNQMSENKILYFDDYDLTGWRPL